MFLVMYLDGRTISGFTSYASNLLCQENLFAEEEDRIVHFRTFLEECAGIDHERAMPRIDVLLRLLRGGNNLLSIHRLGVKMV